VIKIISPCAATNEKTPPEKWPMLPFYVEVFFYIVGGFNPSEKY